MDARDSKKQQRWHYSIWALANTATGGTTINQCQQQQYQQAAVVVASALLAWCSKQPMVMTMTANRNT